MMGSEQADEYYEYKDSEISLRVPSYLRQKRDGPLFETGSKKGKPHVLLSFAVDFKDKAGEVQRSVMMQRTPGVTEDMPGVRQRVIRRGETSYLADGLELLISDEYARTGDVYHNYAVLFPLGSRHVYAVFFGQRDLAEFEKVCMQIVSSIRLVESVGGSAARPRARAAGGLGRARSERLAIALDGLPREIAYLRDPILAIAMQDQELLGSGEGDISPVERALERVAKPGEMKLVARAHADLLHDWLVSLPNQASVWAVPAGFVEGALRGIAAWS